MTERLALHEIDAEMERRSIQQYQRALPDAMKAVALTQDVLDEYGGSYDLATCRDGKKEIVTLDSQTIKAMNGGIFGMYMELRHVGMQPVAEMLVQQGKEQALEQGVPTIIKPLDKM